MRSDLVETHASLRRSARCWEETGQKHILRNKSGRVPRAVFERWRRGRLRDGDETVSATPPTLSSTSPSPPQMPFVVDCVRSLGPARRPQCLLPTTTSSSRCVGPVARIVLQLTPPQLLLIGDSGARVRALL